VYTYPIFVPCCILVYCIVLDPVFVPSCQLKISLCSKPNSPSRSFHCLSSLFTPIYSTVVYYSLVFILYLTTVESLRKFFCYITVINNLKIFFTARRHFSTGIYCTNTTFNIIVKNYDYITRVEEIHTDYKILQY